jgi:hypothetical protein
MKNCVVVGHIVRLGHGTYDHPEFMGKMTGELTREIVMWAALFVDQVQPMGKTTIWLEPGANAVHFQDRGSKEHPEQCVTYTLPEILPFCSLNDLRLLKYGFNAYHDMGAVIFFQKYGFRAEVLRWRNEVLQVVEKYKKHQNTEE